MSALLAILERPASRSADVYSHNAQKIRTEVDTVYDLMTSTNFSVHDGEATPTTGPRPASETLPAATPSRDPVIQGMRNFLMSAVADPVMDKLLELTSTEAVLEDEALKPAMARLTGLQEVRFQAPAIVCLT